ncbi:hypothetical protein ACFE04_029746 [Oxalis oulophora]
MQTECKQSAVRLAITSTRIDSTRLAELEEEHENIFRDRPSGKAFLTTPFKLLCSHHLCVSSLFNFQVYKSKFNSKVDYGNGDGVRLFMLSLPDGRCVRAWHGSLIFISSICFSTC